MELIDAQYAGPKAAGRLKGAGSFGSKRITHKVELFSPRLQVLGFFP
jgi:hypothetical protein